MWRLIHKKSQVLVKTQQRFLSEPVLISCKRVSSCCGGQCPVPVLCSPAALADSSSSLLSELCHTPSQRRQVAWSRQARCSNRAACQRGTVPAGKPCSWLSKQWDALTHMWHQTRSHTYKRTQTLTLPQHVHNTQRCAVHSDARTYVQTHTLCLKKTFSVCQQMKCLQNAHSHVTICQLRYETQSPGKQHSNAH